MHLSLLLHASSAINAWHRYSRVHTLEVYLFPGCGQNQTRLKVTIVDVSQQAQPKIVSQVYLPGIYRIARLVNGLLRVVVIDSLSYPAAVKIFEKTPPDVVPEPAELDAVFARREAEYEAAIRGQSLADWLPEGEQLDATGHASKISYQCRDFLFPNAPTRAGLMTVFTLDPSRSDAVIERTSVFGKVDAIHATAESLYVATSHRWPEGSHDQEATYVHKLDMSAARHILHRGSGAIPGYLHDDFSMDDFNGYLRVATTSTVNTESSGYWKAPTTIHIHVLQNQQDKLLVIGRTKERPYLGEKIVRARFAGKRAYLATIPDYPFFAFDLSDPHNVREGGWLEVPPDMFYLQPVDDDHVIAVGLDLGRYIWGEIQTVASLFDVSDMAQPKETAKLVVGTYALSTGTWQDHRAFNYFPEHKLLAIPFTKFSHDSQSWTGFKSELRIYGVNVEKGFMEVGALSMSDIYAGRNDRDWNDDTAPLIQRSLLAKDSGRDFVYAVFDDGIRVGDLRDLGTPSATTLFEK